MRRSYTTRAPTRQPDKFALDVSSLMEGPAMIDNPVYRGGDDGEVRQASPMPMEVVTGPGEQRSDPDYDDVSNGKGKSTTSSKNPVYGQPTTQRAAGTPQNQPRRSESVEREHSSPNSSPPYRSIRPLQQVVTLPQKKDYRRDSAGDYSTTEPHYDLPNQFGYGESTSRRFTLEEKEQNWLPTTLDSKTPVLTRFHSRSTRESDNMLYETFDQRRSTILFKDWMRQQTCKWRGIYAAVLVAFLLSVAAVGLAVKQQLDGCSCESGDQPKTAPYTGTQTSFEKQVQVVNTTLSQEIKRLDEKLAKHFIQIDLTSDLITTMNNTVLDRIGQLVVGPPGPPGMPGPIGPPGNNGSRGLPGISSCRFRKTDCSHATSSDDRGCLTSILSPVVGYDISGVTCSAGSNETYSKMETSIVNGETGYKCLCMIPVVTQTTISRVACHLRLWECKTT